VLLLEEATKLNINLRYGRSDPNGALWLSVPRQTQADKAFSSCGNFIIATFMKAQPHENPPGKLNFPPYYSGTDFLGDY